MPTGTTSALMFTAETSTLTGTSGGSAGARVAGERGTSSPTSSDPAVAPGRGGGFVFGGGFVVTGDGPDSAALGWVSPPHPVSITRSAPVARIDQPERLLV